MSDANERGPFRTLRGFLDGEEPDEETYFAYCASLRIFGVLGDLEDITRRLGVAPTNSHRRGERRRPNSPPHQHDMWAYQAPVPEAEPLDVHIDRLWQTFREHKTYLLELKKTVTVDVFLGYRSNCDHAGLEVPCTSLEMFIELQIPFGVSIIIA